MASISNHAHSILWDVRAPQYAIFNDCSHKPPLNYNIGQFLQSQWNVDGIN